LLDLGSAILRNCVSTDESVRKRYTMMVSELTGSLLGLGAG